MLKSIKSNNSPGHSHNRLPSVVDLSVDSCPGFILKRNNKMNNTICETVRPNGAKVTLCDHDENGRIIFIVKSSHSHDIRFYGNYNSAVSRFNEIVENENAKGGI